MSVTETTITKPKKQLEFYKDLSEQLQQENQQLKKEYDKALELLYEYNMPCEIDGFMDKNIEYCSINCSVDEEVFKNCWRRYIKQTLRGVINND